MSSTTPIRICIVLALVVAAARAQSPFATTVVEFEPAPGQWVNDPLYNSPACALGAPSGGDPNEPGIESLVSLGGFGGYIILAFDHTVMDDPANPFGLDAIVFGNALWVTGNPNRKWAECGVIEISRDTNGNGQADDPWYLIPGSHINAPGYPASFVVATWDDDLDDDTWPPRWPPADEEWIPPGQTGTWTTAGFRLPPSIFDVMVLQNPLGPGVTSEGVYGYADLSPAFALPAEADSVEFFTRPDNPFRVGLTPGCGGGDAFDIAWAVDPATWQPAGLDGFDFIRITTAVDFVLAMPPLGELSTEVDAITDVAEGRLGDTENDGDIDLDDFALLVECLLGPGTAVPPSPCRVLDFDQDGNVDQWDAGQFQAAFEGP